MFSLPVEQPDPRTEAAALLARLVEHEGLPEDLRHEVGRVGTDKLMNVIDLDAPEMIAAALALYERA